MDEKKIHKNDDFHPKQMIKSETQSKVKQIEKSLVSGNMAWIFSALIVFGRVSDKNLAKSGNKYIFLLGMDFVFNDLTYFL